MFSINETHVDVTALVLGFQNTQTEVSINNMVFTLHLNSMQKFFAAKIARPIL